ncbi:Chromosome segregation ATPase [Geosmithia morbida]|uniref:Structural maintenance of chromosomes protein 5 n=1 Tax=Geosmithia morbida TaxID=1094350 RepID=A0A9P4Z103_9HYPO|nr:Chromosome segregation ATPase [Geosmithia morbida]KAF4124634.1 Chromosome segregation ATPase [Geosmithia morbida]
MSSSFSRRRTRDHLGSDDDDGNTTASSGANTPNKRPRLKTNGDAPETNGSVLNDFSPGAIVRVTVENFVTYEKAEFFPGPNLNMVIGPNGTGKSSLVCAICLGLGYSPKHLGRAGSIKEFVKHGKDTATIEIELCKREQDRSNHVIRVQIRREQNNQKWWLNGKETTHKTIQNLMRQLKIQVDNLCQFLPQDRVVEFAASTPIDLLHETLRAGAPEEMLVWQGQLQGLHKDKKELTASIEADSDSLKNLENRQQGLQADVDRIREREEIQTNVENLRAAHLMCRYQEAREAFRAAKERKAKAQRSLRRLESESGPSLEAVNRKQEYARKVGNLIPARRAIVKEAERKSQNLAAAMITAADQVKEFQDKIDAERTGFEAKKRELAGIRAKITSLQADLQNQPPEFNGGDWNQKIRAEDHIKRDLESERRQLEGQIRDLRDKGKRLNGHLNRIAEDIESFDTSQGQQLALMKRNFPDLARGWEWIQEHQDEFEQEVFGPPMVSCSIKDERYSDQVQSLLQNDDFSCFTVQTKNDYKKLSNQLYKVMSLSVVIRSCAHSLGSFKPPVGPDQVRELGLDGFAIDFLEGPPTVLAMFCAERGLHRSGVSLRDHEDAQYEKLVHSGVVSQWAAGKQSYMVRRRKEYGPQAMTTVTKNIGRGRFWTSQPVDTQEKVEMKKREAELKGEHAMLKQEHDALVGKRTDIDTRMAEIDDKIMNRKARHETSMRQIRKVTTDLQYEWDRAAVRRAEAVMRHASSLEAISSAHRSLVEAQLWHLEAESDIEGLKRRNAHIMSQLEEERRIVVEATAASDEAKERGQQLGNETRAIMEPHDEAWRAVITSSCEGKTADEVHMEMEAEEAKLELVHAANPNVLREFDRRAGEMDRLARKIEGSREKLERLDLEIGNLMARWEPGLDRLVSKINDAFAYNFEQINCAGEVRVHKDDDFDLWALDIMVKFRESEQLQQLNAHRQSGGERAVSTIFYLMALQSMAQSPFRVVDEINQGMDPRNERMVHERMVEIACREHTSQYFLITPKLLTGLRYDPKMRVLCIASGEHMPREGSKLDFKRCLRIQKSLKKRVR